jgi:hypothetical protein
LRDASAGQALSRPLRRLLQAPGAVLLRLGERRGDLLLRAHGAELHSAGVPPHGLVPAAGVRSKWGRRENGQVLRVLFCHFFCLLLAKIKSRRTTRTISCSSSDFVFRFLVAPRRIRTRSLLQRTAHPCPSRLLHPARCAQGLLLGVEVWQLDVALLQVAVLVAASLPRTSRKKRAFPPMSGGAASAGVSRTRRACATATQHARPHAR